MNGKRLSKLAQKHIREKYDGFVVNVIAASRNGVPDLLACINGKFYGFEIKGENDKLSSLQAIKIAEIRVAGGVASEVRSLKDIDNAVQIDLPKVT